MKRRLIFKTFLFLALFPALDTYATAQFGDLLVDGKDTFLLYCNPLESYLDTKYERAIGGVELTPSSTACNRGYQATWELRNDSLFLVELMQGCYTSKTDTPHFINLAEEFGSNIVFAKWFSGSLYSPRGGILRYIHAGYASIYEREKYYHLKNGSVDLSYLHHNIIYEEGKIRPSQFALSDTLELLIINNLDTSLFSQFEDKELCNLTIFFTAKGELDTVLQTYAFDGTTNFETIMYKATHAVLANFPPLMRIKHESIDRIITTLSFSSHCIMYPEDYEYGCGR